MRAIFWWAMSILVIGVPAYADSVSGTYVGELQNAVVLIQLVETTGRQLTGHYEQTVLGADGRLVKTNETVTGVSDGKILVLTIKPPELLSDGMSASGSFDGPTLHLSGGGGGKSIDLTLARASEAAYQNYVAFLAGQAARISEQRTQSEQLTKIRALIQRIIAYSTDANAKLAKFPPIEQRFRAITRAMATALERQRSIVGDGQASVARAQIGVAISQAAIRAGNLHDDVMSSYTTISNQVQSTLKMTTPLLATCRSNTATENAELGRICIQLFDTLKSFKPNLDALGRSFQEAESIWNEEHRKQQAILHASDIASR